MELTHLHRIASQPSMFSPQLSIRPPIIIDANGYPAPVVIPSVISSFFHYPQNFTFTLFILS